MALPSGERRVQHPDVEVMRARVGIGQHQVLGHNRRREALPVYRDAELRQYMRLRPLRTEYAQLGRHGRFR